MRKLLSVLCALMIAGSAFAAMNTNADVAPGIAVGPVAIYEPPQTDALWDIIFMFNTEPQCGNSVLQLGAARAGGYLWVTGAGQSSTSATDNRIYRLTTAGVLMDSTTQPSVASGWGFRDMAYDGTYLYAGCEAATIYAWDPTAVPFAWAPAMNITKPAGAAIVRALAYDPVNDRFWTGNFGSNIICFSRTGAVIWTGAPLGLAGIYGMAYDNVSAGGPFLWIYDQSGSPVTTMKKVSGVGTTPPAPVIAASYQLPTPAGVVGGTAGGCEGTTAWPGYGYAMTCLDQATPDEFIVYEVVAGGPPPNVTISMVPVTTPIIIPPGGGSFDFNATIHNAEATSQTFSVWIMVTLPNGNPYGPVLGPVTITLGAGASIARLRTQAVPASAPAGNYTYTGNVGSYPGTVYNSSSFPFAKSAAGDAGWVGEWANTGESFEASATVAPASFALLGNYPNPFNPTTTINFSLGSSDNVKLSVYDLSGRLVSTLVDGSREAGTHAVSFDASGLASGVYVYRLTAGAQTASAKMILSK